MKAVIKEIMSSDVDLKKYNPTCEELHVSIEVEIGPENSRGAHIFQMVLYSYERLLESCGVEVWVDNWEPVKWGRRPILVMKDYSFDVMHSFLKDFVNGIEKDSWPEIAEEINKFALWEFDQYKG